MIEGKQFVFCLSIVMMATMLYAARYARQGKKINIRKLAALEAIPDAIGRATEAGRPVHFTPGLAALTWEEAPQTFAAMSLLSYVARLTARFDVRLIVTLVQPDVLPLAQETVRQAYLSEDRYSSLSNADVWFVANEQFPYAAAVSGIIKRDEVAANFMFGAFWAENLMIAEVGTQVDAFQVSGTASVGQVPFFVTTTDYCLIGEELYAASAFVADDVVQLGAILGQEICKGIAALLLVVGVIVTALGSSYFMELLSL